MKSLHLTIKALFLRISILGLYSLLITHSSLAHPLDSLSLLYQGEVYFDFGKHDLRPSADSIIQKGSIYYQKNDQTTIHITAHTDAIGDQAKNQELSKARGQAVQNKLIKLGVDPNKIKIQVFGEERPIASNDEEQGRQKNRRATLEVFERIPQVPMTTIEGQVKDRATGKGLMANVIIHGKALRDSFRTNQEGYFKRAVPQDIVVGLDIFAKGYFFETQMLKTKLGVAPKLQVQLPPVTIGKSVDIKNLYFVGNSPRLLKRSQPELPKLYKFMMINDDIRIEIAGHVNVPFVHPEFITDEEFNLSVNRARTIHDYLVAKGISKDRMQFKGYGNSKMRFPKAKGLKEQELNRRVEIMILGTHKVLSKAEKLKDFPLSSQSEYQEAVLKCKQQDISESTDCMIGKKIFDFEGISYQNDSINSEEMKGKMIVINFWFTACPPCMAELKGLNEIVKQYEQEKDIAFISFTTDSRKTLEEDFFPFREFKFKIIPDSKHFIRKELLHTWGFPSTFIVDKKGIIQKIIVGAQGEEALATKEIKEEIIPELEKYLN